MPDQSAPLLVLTVGTGTAGRSSNLASGLRTALAKTAPARFWLVPSTDEMSLLTADEVRKDHPSFSPWSADETYPALPRPDDLEDCRRRLCDILRTLSSQRRPNQRLLLNPTSGTKQMTAAAVLAALDCGLGEIVFISGERADGVVVTGTERLVSFDASAYFQERDLAQARAAFELGAYAVSERLLSVHRPALARSHAISACLVAWSRQDYAAAAAHAARFDDKLRSHLVALADHTAHQEPAPAVLSDLLFWADQALRRRDPDTCLVLSYKSLELGARYALYHQTGLLPPYALTSIDTWRISSELKSRFRKDGRNGPVFFGLTHAMQALHQMGDPIGQTFQSDPRYFWTAQARNELTHHIQPASVQDGQRLLDLARNLLEENFDLPPPPALPSL